MADETRRTNTPPDRSDREAAAQGLVREEATDAAIKAALVSLLNDEKTPESLDLLKGIEPARLACFAGPKENVLNLMNLVGARCFGQGLLDASLSYLEYALSLDNTHSDTLFNLGCALHAAGRDDIALKFLVRIESPDAGAQNLIRDVQADLAASAGAAGGPGPSSGVGTPGGPRPAGSLPASVTIEPGCDVRQQHRMLFGEGVVVQRDSWLNIAHDNPAVRYMIEFGSGVNIGRRATISASNRIVFGRNVLLGPNVLVTDHNHEYRHVGVAVVQQGITSTTNSVFIGDGTWIGTNSVVVGNVRIGKGCAVGANSIVTRDVPDYCVVAGNPARVVKAFDPEAGRWVSMKADEDLAGVLSKRGDLLNYVIPITNLHSLQVEVSSACNLRCPQCFSHIEGHKTAMFSRQLWDARVKPLLGQFKEMHLVGIGEPLLCKDFFYFAEDSVKSSVQVHTTSNLQLVTPELAGRLVASGLTTLSFSCDAIEPEMYASIRVNGTFARLKESLDLINRFKRERGTEAPQLILNFGAMRRNVEQLPGVVRFAHDNAVSQVIAYHDVVYVDELKDESTFLNQELSDREFAEAERLAAELGVSMFMPGLFSRPIKYSPASGPYCKYPFHHLWIYSDGRVGPCCMDFPDRYVLGDLNTSSIEDVWNSAPILRLRRELLTSPSYTCRYCVMHGKMDLSDPRYFFRFKGSEEYLRKLQPALREGSS